MPTQWVNLTPTGDADDDRWLEAGETRAQLGRTAHVTVSFRSGPGRGRLTVRAEAGSAVYSPAERRSRDFAATLPGDQTFASDGRGRALVAVPLSLAGGDVYTVEARDDHGTVLTTERLETRRRLYFQLVQMDGVPRLSASDVQSFQDAYWRDDIYLQLVEISPGLTLPLAENWTPSILDDVRRRYDRSKVPNSFVMVVVKKIYTPEAASGRDRVTVHAHQPVTIDTHAKLIDNTERGARWYVSVEYRSGRHWHTVPEDRCSRPAWQPVANNGMTQFIIAADTLPSGARDVRWQVNAYTAAGGLSAVNNNMIVIGTHNSLDQVTPAEHRTATIVHEIGHKVGLSTGEQSTAGLDRNPTQYIGAGHYGPHCYEGTTFTPTRNFEHDINPNTPATETTFHRLYTGSCVMFGHMRSSEPHFAPDGSQCAGSVNFCRNCAPAARKLDPRAGWVAGIRTQF